MSQYEYGLPHEIWAQIYEEIEARIPPRELTFGKVLRRDTNKKQVFTEEMGTTPIPVVAYNLDGKYYDTAVPAGTTYGTTGTTIPLQTTLKTFKTNDLKVRVPEIGDTILIAMIGGQRRLPYCIGVIQGVGEE